MLDSSTGAALLRHVAWLRVRNCSPETIRQRIGAVRRFYRWGEIFDADAVTPKMLGRWQIYLSARLSPQSVATYSSHIRAFLAWCEENGLIPSDPGLVLATPKLPRRMPRPISQASLDIAIETATPRVRLWLILAGYAGLRAAEISRLRREDILDTADPPVIVVSGKGNRDRVVPINRTVADGLFVYGIGKAGYLFPGPSGHIAPQTVTNRSAEHLHELGIAETLHSCRHYFATQLYRNTRDLRQVQELLGHSSPATTSIYAGYAQERAIEAVRSLDKKLEPENGENHDADR